KIARFEPHIHHPQVARHLVRNLAHATGESSVELLFAVQGHQIFAKVQGVVSYCLTRFLFDQVRILTPDHIPTGRPGHNDLVAPLHSAIESTNIFLSPLASAFNITTIEGWHAAAYLWWGNDTNLVTRQHLDRGRTDIGIIVIDRAGVEEQDLAILPLRFRAMTGKPFRERHG